MELSSVKVNENQQISVTCIVTGDPAAPDSSQVQLQYMDGAGGTQFGTLTRAEPKGSYLIVTFTARLPAGNQVTCSVSGNNPTPIAVITPEFYCECNKQIGVYDDIDFILKIATCSVER